MDSFSRNVLDIDLPAKTTELSEALVNAVFHQLKRRGVVLGVSGGIDSACVAALAVRALGPQRVFGLLMPESHVSDESRDYGRKMCEHLGIAYVVEDITAMLEAAGCYQRQKEALQIVLPEFETGMRWKIAIHGSPLNGDVLRFFHAIVELPGGQQKRARLTQQAYLGIVAATNFKQRIRKMLEYYHADRLNYAVAGTPNRLEYDQGFFVKLGDGAADVKPIAGLYKTQVYALARHLGVIDEILVREPTTETYSLEQSQEEFYFSVPWRELDLLLWAKNHDISAADAAQTVGYGADQVSRVYGDIDQKRRATAYLHASPLLLEAIERPADIHKFDQQRI